MMCSANISGLEITGPASVVGKYIQKALKDYIALISSQDDIKQLGTMSITLKPYVSPVINGMGEIQQNRENGLWNGIDIVSDMELMENYYSAKIQV